MADILAMKSVSDRDQEGAGYVHFNQYAYMHMQTHKHVDIRMMTSVLL